VGAGDPIDWIAISAREIAISVQEIVISVREIVISIREVAISAREVAISVREIAISVREIAISVWEVAISVWEVVISVRQVLISAAEIGISAAQITRSSLLPGRAYRQLPFRLRTGANQNNLETAQKLKSDAGKYLPVKYLQRCEKRRCGTSAWRHYRPRLETTGGAPCSDRYCLSP
jgi:hypothetical protein